MALAPRASPRAGPVVPRPSGVGERVSSPPRRPRGGHPVRRNGRDDPTALAPRESPRAGPVVPRLPGGGERVSSPPRGPRGGHTVRRNGRDDPMALAPRESPRAGRLLSRVPQAWESEFRLHRAGRAVATRCAGMAETIQWHLRRASHRALGLLSRVPQAWESEFRLRRAGRAVATRCAGMAETIQWHLRRASHRALGLLSRVPQAWESEFRLRRASHRGLLKTMAAALAAFGTGMALVLIAAGFLGRTTTTPPDRVLPIAGRGPADKGSHAMRAPQASVPSHDEPRDNPRVQTATPVTAARPADAKPQPTLATPDRRMASGPAAVQGQAVASPATPTSPVEVVAIRFGIIDRTLPEWTWSWRVSIHTPNDTARVNARIEFIEFHGSIRRLVAYKEFCDLRITGGGLAFIEGTHTLSAADSRRISTMTATVSAATDAAELTACRPRS